MMSLLIPAADFYVDHRTGVGNLPRRFGIDQTPDGLMRS
jgi:hypothetical protein